MRADADALTAATARLGPVWLVAVFGPWRLLIGTGVLRGA